MTIQEKLSNKIYEILPHKRIVIEEMDSNFKLVEQEPICLADILLAIQTKRGQPDSEEEGIKLENDIIQIVRGSFGVKGYNLSQDNILNQSDEFCEMVLVLLGNKKDND